MNTFRCDISTGPGQQIVWRKGYEVSVILDHISFDESLWRLNIKCFIKNVSVLSSTLYHGNIFSSDPIIKSCSSETQHF